VATTDWDISINGTGHFIYPNEQYRYVRGQIPIQREQIDTSSEPGEQSLTSWWYRSQSSFHMGMDQEYWDTVRSNDTDQYRFDDSYGCNPAVKGEVRLIPKPNRHGDLLSYNPTTKGKPAQFSASDGSSGVVYPSGNKVYRLEAKPDAVPEQLQTTGDDNWDVVLDVCVLGDDVWMWVLGQWNGRNEYQIVRTDVKDKPGRLKPFFAVLMSDLGITTEGNHQTARLSFRNSTLTATLGRYWWNLPSVESLEDSDDAADLPVTTTDKDKTARLIFMHPQPDYCFLDVAKSNGPIVATGTYVKKDDIIYGNRSHIWACTVAETQSDETSNLLDLDPPFVTAETPAGEIIYRMDLSMNFVFIGTTIGLRVAEMDTNGDILIGPPHDTDLPVQDICNFGQYVWFTGSRTGGLYRLDLRNATNRQSYKFAYWRDAEVYDPSQLPIIDEGGMPVEERAAAHVEMFGNTGGPVWFWADKQGDGSFKGYFYSAFYKSVDGDDMPLIDQGWIRTPRIRMDTWEFKLFQYLRTLWDPRYIGGLIRPMWIPRKGDPPEALDSLHPSDPTDDWHLMDDTGYLDTDASHPGEEKQPMIDVGYVFHMRDNKNNDGTNGKDPRFKGYQVKAKPTEVADKELTIPLLCARRERMRQGRTVERSVWERVSEMEELQRTGQVVDYVDHGTGETGKVIVDECQYVSTHVPQSKQEQGDRLGILNVKLRVVDSPQYD